MKVDETGMKEVCYVFVETGNPASIVKMAQTYSLEVSLISELRLFLVAKEFDFEKHAFLIRANEATLKATIEVFEYCTGKAVAVAETTDRDVFELVEKVREKPKTTPIIIRRSNRVVSAKTPERKKKDGNNGG